MSEPLIVALDVGGTQIKAAAVIGGDVAQRTIGYYDSHAAESAEEIIARFVYVFERIMAQSGADAQADGLGLAFPGPFDYEAGISRIRGLGKFDALYGVSVKELLEKELRANEITKSRLAPNFRIVFENDAALFGLGEAAPGGGAEGFARAVCLTIGTGLGSCFLESGHPVKRRNDVPGEGWLYGVPYAGGIADDYISRRGILNLATGSDLDTRKLDVRDLADLATAGDPKALDLFERFGQRSASILTPHLLPFRPDVIVFGGQISKSARLFAPAFEKEAKAGGLSARIRISADTLSSTLRGIYRLIAAR